MVCLVDRDYTVSSISSWLLEKNKDRSTSSAFLQSAQRRPSTGMGLGWMYPPTSIAVHVSLPITFLEGLRSLANSSLWQENWSVAQPARLRGSEHGRKGSTIVQTRHDISVVHIYKVSGENGKLKLQGTTRALPGNNTTGVKEPRETPYICGPQL